MLFCFISVAQTSSGSNGEDGIGEREENKEVETGIQRRGREELQKRERERGRKGWRESGHVAGVTSKEPRIISPQFA